MKNQISAIFARLPKQLEIYRIAGIPIRLDYSWFIIFIVYTWAIASIYLPTLVPNLNRFHYWTLGVITTLLFFLSVLAHELAHSFFARRAGIGIEGITLFIFG